MAGRRLLDATKLLNATRKIAQQHLELRTEQLDRYNKTSTLAKAVKSQTDRVTVTAQAAIALARRLNEVDHHGDESYIRTPPAKPPKSSRSTGESEFVTRDVSKTRDIPSEVEGEGVEGHISGHERDITFQVAQGGQGGGRDNADIAAQDDLGGMLNASSTPVLEPMVNSGERRKHISTDGTASATKAAVEDASSSTVISDLPGRKEATIEDRAQHNARGVLLPLKTPFQMRESRVPSSRVGRLWQYGGLATSMAFSALGEGIRRVAGGGSDGGSLLLNAGNLERLVAKLSRMRGAALKLGQMMSFQDLKMLPPAIHEVLQRVQDSADYMPASQRDRVLSNNLGSEWRGLFSKFDEVPIAAASIGQVHRATMKSTGREVAVKVQYPGVANSIDSDLNNLSLLLTASKLLPRGLFLDKTIANARVELAWECDYVREAECAKRFKTLLADEPEVFVVPDIIDDASGREVLTAEFMHGRAVTKIPSLTQTQRDWVGTQILRLCLREIFEFRFMQTDPNWTNFLYNVITNKLELLDFGASRDYPTQFVRLYGGVLAGASQGDTERVKDLSIQLGYLTGSESRQMVDAHVQSVLTLAEPFGKDAPEVYDFRDQTITDRVRGLIPLMVRERLAPPPEETYSLHRKLSGAFLLCARLGSRVRCRELFAAALQ